MHSAEPTAADAHMHGSDCHSDYRRDVAPWHGVVIVFAVAARSGWAKSDILSGKCKIMFNKTDITNNIIWQTFSIWNEAIRCKFNPFEMCTYRIHTVRRTHLRSLALCVLAEVWVRLYLVSCTQCVYDPSAPFTWSVHIHPFCSLHALLRRCSLRILLTCGNVRARARPYTHTHADPNAFHYTRRMEHFLRVTQLIWKSS